METAARTPRLVHFVHLHLGVSHVKQLQQVLPPLFVRLWEGG
jgi:hypothetical protein